MKRFYKQASFAETPDGYAITLDGKPIRTTAGKPLIIDRHQKLAQEIAAEWEAQVETIKPSTMPMTQLATTALDRVVPERKAILSHLVAYAETDLLCYRAQSPAGLRARQDTHWQPLLDWLDSELGAALVVTEGIVAIEQPSHALTRIHGCFDGLDTWRLTAAQVAAAASGSAVLALALAWGRVDGEQVFTLSQIDDDWQTERWGDDAEAVQRRKNLRADILAADKLLRLIG